MRYNFFFLLLISVILNATVNINTADKNELMKLPYIGEKKSQRIIDYRTKYGNFRNVEELTNVSGIGDKTLEKLRPLITINSHNQKEDNSLRFAKDLNSKININLASGSELKMISSLGDKARKIMRYRNKHYFVDIDELRYIGVSQEDLDSLKDFITTKIDVNMISCEEFLKLKFFEKKFLEDIAFYKKKKIRIKKSFLQKRFEEYNIDKNLRKLLFVKDEE